MKSCHWPSFLAFAKKRLCLETVNFLTAWVFKGPEKMKTGLVYYKYILQHPGFSNISGVGKLKELNIPSDLRNKFDKVADEIKQGGGDPVDPVHKAKWANCPWDGVVHELIMGLLRGDLGSTYNSKHKVDPVRLPFASVV